MSFPFLDNVIFYELVHKIYVQYNQSTGIPRKKANGTKNKWTRIWSSQRDLRLSVM